MSNPYGVKNSEAEGPNVPTVIAEVPELPGNKKTSPKEGFVIKEAITPKSRSELSNSAAQARSRRESTPSFQNVNW